LNAESENNGFCRGFWLILTFTLLICKINLLLIMWLLCASLQFIWLCSWSIYLKLLRVSAAP